MPGMLRAVALSLQRKDTRAECYHRLRESVRAMRAS